MFKVETNPYSAQVEAFDHHSDPTQTSNVNRKHSGKYQDVWASILFYLHLAVVLTFAIILGIQGINSSNANASSPSPSSSPPPPSNTTNVTVTFSLNDYDIKDWAPQLALASVIAFVFSFLWLQLIKLFPTFMIYVSLYWTVFTFLGVAVFFLFLPSSSKFVAIIFFVFALLFLLYAYLVRNRIPFASALLGKSISIIKKFPATIWVAYIFLVISMLYLGVWVFGLSGAMNQSSNVAIVIAFIFSLYWTFEVLRNSVHVTVAGTVATHYFYALNMPPNPTLRSLHRATTKSFGSICFGSLIVSIIQTLRALVSSARQNADNDNLLCQIICCCLECLLSLIHDLIQYLNKWAYIQVALYGKSFVSAAKDTWELFKNQGIEILINDDLTSNVLGMGCLISGLLCATAAGVWTFFINKDLVIAITVISLFIGLFMTSQAMAVIESAIASYYVCYADDPLTLQRTDPVFYQTITERHNLLMTS